MAVAVDCHGADHGPAEVARGAVVAAADGIESILFGPVAELAPVVAGVAGVRVVDAPLSIAKAADPASAVRNNKDASIVRVAQAVKAGEADAFVAGGSTGAALAAGTLIVRRGRGVSRPALAVPFPRPGTGLPPVTVLDVGANPEVRPEWLVQFAYLGAAFAEAVLGIERPRVALLSNGAEADRGRSEVQEAHATLKAHGERIRFVGNVEGVDLLGDAAEVIITDGFSGNIMLKTAEGVAQALMGAIRATALQSTRGKAGGLLLRSALGGLREEIDPERYGGAYMLGLRALGVVPHGRFGAAGFEHAIRLAARGADSGIADRVTEALTAAGALRTADPPASVPGDR